jgi:antitoxin PrlF
MSVARLTSKGQVTIPKEVRDQMGLRTGDEIEFVETEHGFRVEKRFDESPFAPFRGIARKKLKDLGFDSTDEYIAAIRGR